MVRDALIVVLVTVLWWYSGHALKCYVCGGIWGTMCPKEINETTVEANCTTSCLQMGFKPPGAAFDDDAAITRECALESMSCEGYLTEHEFCKMCKEDLCNGPDPPTPAAADRTHQKDFTQSTISLLTVAFGLCLTG